jgi:hypothetical protein
MHESYRIYIYIATKLKKWRMTEATAEKRNKKSKTGNVIVVAS